MKSQLIHTAPSTAVTCYQVILVFPDGRSAEFTGLNSDYYETQTTVENNQPVLYGKDAPNSEKRLIAIGKWMASSKPMCYP